MNRRELGLGVATTTLTLGAASTALAQNRPVDPQVFIAGFDAQAARLPSDQQADVRAVYRLTGGKPIWTADRLRVLQEVAAGAERHALPAGDFFDFVGLAADPGSAEIRTTAAAIAYARVLAEGRVRPETVEDLWEMQKNSVDIPTGLTQAISANQLSQWFDNLAPTDIGYTNLSAGYARYRRITRAGGWPAFRQGGTIEPGASDARIPALVARLVAEGDLSASAGERLKGNLAYGSDLQQAVRSFQTRHGLGSDGRIGPGTQRSLGATAEDRARQIALNLERRRWLKRDLNPERIEVNTAAAIMVYWKDGKPVHSNRVVVGSVENQTPSLEKPFASVVANPPWTVPMGIARREILPKGPGYLAAHDMYINADGWVVQRAGPQSSLGYVKVRAARQLRHLPARHPVQGGLQPVGPPAQPRLRPGAERRRVRASAAVARSGQAGRIRRRPGQPRNQARHHRARDRRASALLDRLRRWSGPCGVPRGRLSTRRQAGSGPGHRRQPAARDRRWSQGRQRRRAVRGRISTVSPRRRPATGPVGSGPD